MKTFEVVFAKETKIIGKPSLPMQSAKQIYHTDSDRIDVTPPPGFYILSVCEILPDVNQFKNASSILKSEG